MSQNISAAGGAGLAQVIPCTFVIVLPAKYIVNFVESIIFIFLTPVDFVISGHFLSVPWSWVTIVHTAVGLVFTPCSSIPEPFENYIQHFGDL